MKRERAFALAMVTVLGAIVALASAVMLERRASQRLMVRRQLDRYQEWHGTRGVQEVVAMWMRSLSSESIASQVLENPGVLRMTLADGTELHVSLHDGQGTCLASLDALGAQEKDDLAPILESISDDPVLALRHDLFRSLGPASLSLSSAPEPLLLAFLSHLAPDEPSAERMLEFIVRKRDAGSFTPTDIAECCNLGGLTQEARAAFGRLLVAEPVLWRVDVELREPHVWNPEGEVRAAYEGLYLIDRGVTRPGRATGMETLRQSTPFLGWKRRDAQANGTTIHEIRP